MRSEEGVGIEASGGAAIVSESAAWMCARVGEAIDAGSSGGSATGARRAGEGSGGAGVQSIGRLVGALGVHAARAQSSGGLGNACGTGDGGGTACEGPRAAGSSGGDARRGEVLGGEPTWSEGKGEGGRGSVRVVG